MIFQSGIRLTVDESCSTGVFVSVHLRGEGGLVLWALVMFLVGVLLSGVY